MNDFERTLEILRQPQRGKNDPTNTGGLMFKIKLEDILYLIFIAAVIYIAV